MKKHWVWGLAIAALGIESLVLASLARADGADVLERLIEPSAPVSGKASAAPAPSGTTTSHAAAQQGETAAKNNNIIHLTPDRTEVIRLQEDASSVVVTNPAHASVVLDTPRLLVVMPRQPGATSFFVLNQAGEKILERDVVVSTAPNQYVRIRRACADGQQCPADAFYYCPDGCYEVTTVPPTGSINAPSLGGGSTPVIDNAPPPQDPAQASPPEEQAQQTPPALDNGTGLDTEETLDDQEPTEAEETEEQSQ